MKPETTCQCGKSGCINCKPDLSLKPQIASEASWIPPEWRAGFRMGWNEAIDEIYKKIKEWQGSNGDGDWKPSDILALKERSSGGT